VQYVTFFILLGKVYYTEFGQNQFFQGFQICVALHIRATLQLPQSLLFIISLPPEGFIFE
jgi:hypothetical protein